MPYAAPTAEYLFYLNHCTSMARLAQAGAFPNFTPDLTATILDEAGRFAAGPIAAINRTLDTHGARYADGGVLTAPGHADTYRAFIEGGWTGLAQPERFGGQALPSALNAACLEFWHSGSMGFAIGPLLTMGAAEALHAHADEALQALYLPKLVTGEWTAAMALTESGAGSDLSGMATRAEPDADGTYRLFGSKIFITCGEHDLAANIVHLVLARLPDAPAGTRGISLFLAPKIIPGPGGALGARNDIVCTGIEKKVGLHGAPTCAMTYGQTDGAKAWLIGAANGGLAAMFTMMNNARLGVAIQGVAVSEAAYQQARAYAQERKQGRPPGWTSAGPAPISAHPDIRRTLMTMRALTVSARLIVLAAADAIDRAGHETSAEARGAAKSEADLLIPIAKAFATDSGVEIASMAMQVHGGLGYVEDTGIAQLWRDARIAPIYEGTNGIQAIDLVTRKLSAAGGQSAERMIARLKTCAGALTDQPALPIGQAGANLAAACAALEQATRHLRAAAPDDALAGAAPYLRLFGLVAGAAFLGEAVLRCGPAGHPHDELAALLRFHAERLLPESDALMRVVVSGAGALDGAGAALQLA